MQKILEENNRKIQEAQKKLVSIIMVYSNIIEFKLNSIKIPIIDTLCI